MKRLIIITVMLMLATTAMAQNSPIDQGSKVIEGSFSFVSQSGDLYERFGETVTTVTFAPSLEFFIAPNLMIGGATTFTNFSVGEYNSTRTSYGAVVGYYFGDAENTEIKGLVYPYIKAIFLFSNSNDDTITSIGSKFGINYMITNAVALDAGLIVQNDSFSREGYSNSISGTIVTFGTGITAFIY